jgi:hypothetical protein
MNENYVIVHERANIFSVYRVDSVGTDNILVWICEVWFTTYYIQTQVSVV